jgi:ADP-ribose pyrophosphatase YjhB (NUDIX family)
MELIINDNNLGINEIQEFNSKVRALLIDENNNILIANYGNILLFPGGSIDCNETINKAILRELKEETGIDYSIDELENLIVLKHYQKDYPKREGNLQNRLITTYYFIGKYKGISSQKLTEKEQKDNLRLELVSLDNLEELVLNNQTNNPRNLYFVKELITILEYYKHTYSKLPIKKININL